MTTPKRIAVAGATGRLGSQIVDVLEERGHTVVKASRTYGVDVITKEGLAEALDGVDAIVDAATQATPDEDAATEFFTTSTANLHEVGHAAGVSRMLTLSIIGTDQFDSGFIGGVNAHEVAAKAGSIPTDIVRASQFHEFVGQLLDWCTLGDVAYLPKMRTQPVSARALAEAIADLVDEPSDGGQMFEIAGPQEELLPDLARLLIEAEGRPVEIEAVVDPVDGERH
ncbi:MAG: NAD(P)H-binding protein, partial [Acidimicrobiales bacterium]